VTSSYEKYGYEIVVGLPDPATVTRHVDNRCSDGRRQAVPVRNQLPSAKSAQTGRRQGISLSTHVQCGETTCGISDAAAIPAASTQGTGENSQMRFFIEFTLFRPRLGMRVSSIGRAIKAGLASERRMLKMRCAAPYPSSSGRNRVPRNAAAGFVRPTFWNFLALHQIVSRSCFI
jgi:hypothetical protein